MSAFNLTRQAFAAALKRCEEKVPLTPYQRNELWCAFNDIAPRDAPPPPPMQMNRWTVTAIELLEPLRREIATCQHARSRGDIERRYAGIKATLPGRHGRVAAGATRKPLSIDVIEAFDTYFEELIRIRWEMENALREGHHWISSGPSIQPTPIDIIVENEHAEHTTAHPRYAGTRHWTQWAKPGLRKQLTEIFEQAHAPMARRNGAWKPYPVPTTAKKGTS
jgi:hypothetical protein